MQLIKKLLPANLKCDTHEHFAAGQPSVVTIHWVGPYPNQTPDIVRDWWIKSGGEASAHFVIKDDECMQCWETDKVAWHAGCKSGNSVSIGIEVIPCDKEGRFSEKSIATLKELLDSLPYMPVVRHHDWTGKDCPRYYCNSDKWQELLKQLGR
jgi:N-acetylmuramoyl-L-alanine amidase CwlA